METNTSLFDHYKKADALMFYINLGLVVYALVLASWYNTWLEAIVIGGLTAGALAFIYVTAAGSVLCRIAMGCGFMVLTALHIHQSHGMVEFHFGVFALLAMLLYYRDWVPIVAAAGVIAVHHFSFYYMQASGADIWVLTSTENGVWIIFLHAGYVVAETALLVFFAINLKGEAQQSVELMRTTNEITRNNKINLGHRTSGTTDLLVQFNDFTEDMDKLTREVKVTANQLYSQGEELLRVTDHMQSASATQQKETTLIATAVEQMTASIASVSDNATIAADASTALDENARQARTVSEQTKNHVQLLADSVDEAVNTIESLNEQANSIGSVLDVIRGIAEQTNLLALNAAIEAARAGEQGRGFAVVADEVRTLAQRTQESTKEIDEMIEKLQSGSQNAVSVIEQSRERGRESVEGTNCSLELMEQVSAAVQHINEMNSMIASSTNEQSSVVAEISENVSNILNAANVATEDSDVTASASRELLQISESLKILSDKFENGS